MLLQRSSHSVSKSSAPLNQQSIYINLSILLKIQKWPLSLLCGFHLYLWSILQIKAGGREGCLPCKQYCKPQFQNRENPLCPHRQKSTDAEFCSCFMSCSIKTRVRTLREDLFPIKTLKQSYQRSKAAPPVLQRTLVRGRDLQQWMNEKVRSNRSFSFRKISRILFAVVHCWNLQLLWIRAKRSSDACSFFFLFLFFQKKERLIWRKSTEKNAGRCWCGKFSHYARTTFSLWCHFARFLPIACWW